MAILETCSKCGTIYCTSVFSCKIFCDECNGTNEAKRKEEERWKALSLENKIEELRIRVAGLENHNSWEGRI